MEPGDAYGAGPQAQKNIEAWFGIISPLSPVLKRNFAAKKLNEIERTEASKTADFAVSSCLSVTLGTQVTVTGDRSTVGGALDKKTFDLLDQQAQGGGSVLDAMTGFGNQRSLGSIPTGNIERIEIINNPSAKYDASGQPSPVKAKWSCLQRTCSMVSGFGRRLMAKGLRRSTGFF